MIAARDPFQPNEKKTTGPDFRKGGEGRLASGGRG